jgi:hypothetical protein
MLTKSGLKPGDALVLTKPLGFGVTTTALKQEKAEADDVLEVVNWMKRLNKSAGQLAVEFGLHAGTDITGFGLMGHALEMAEASGAGLRIEYSKLPFISCARKYAEKGCFPGGAFDNKMYFGGRVRLDKSLDEADLRESLNAFANFLRETLNSTFPQLKEQLDLRLANLKDAESDTRQQLLIIEQLPPELKDERDTQRLNVMLTELRAEINLLQHQLQQLEEDQQRTRRVAQLLTRYVYPWVGTET